MISTALELKSRAHLAHARDAKKHIALLFDDRKELDASVADYINEGLKRGQFCVYGSVYLRDGDHMEKISALITNYEENVQRGNLMIVDLAPFYISALTGDIKPFEEAKQLFAEKAKDRTDKHVRFVGDGTGFLFKNRHFDECAMIEQWWQEKPFEGSYVCPYQRALLETRPHEAYAKHAVMVTHDVVIDISGRPLETKEYSISSWLPQKMKKVTRVRYLMEEGNDGGK